MFVNRRDELQFLQQHYASDRAELFVLYGRRRVGKTELLAQFCRGKRHIFFVADLDTEPVLRASLSAVVNVNLLGVETAGAVYPSWDDIFLLLAHHAQTERLVVVLDEFSYLVAAHAALPSILQRLWDSDLRHTKLMLILCGSHIGMMEKAVLGYNAPLYGRRTAQYSLEPLSFRDTCIFFPDYDLVNQVRAYAVFGGTPAYLRTINVSQPLLTLIRDQVLTRTTFLYDEVRFLLQQELREPRNYFAILEAIAAGRTKLNEIKQATGLDGVTAYLKILQELRLVEREVPATEKQPHKSRRGLYRIRDPFFRFWFRFLHPYRTLLEQGGSQVVLDTFVAPHLDMFTGPIFEKVCQQFLWRAGLDGELPFIPLQIGRWWRANEEIDIVAIGKDAALLVECKWSRRPVGMDILRNLERKVNLVSNELGVKQQFLGLCARSDFTSQVEDEAAQRNDLLLFDLPRIVTGESSP
ncbi:MAG: ATP-binding protein [Chloroflexi bacterium]|nr:ATP-binding protein [Chloroflexota bacterium]MBU1660762.1 ATP-binding protein [Chloroflexota bacterium]